MTTTIRRFGAALIGLLLGLFVLLAIDAGPASASAGEAPTITTQPVDTTGYEDGLVQFTAAASSSVPPTILWEYSHDNGATWNAAGQYTGTYTLGSLVLSESGDLLRAEFTNPYGTTYTSGARLTVLPAQPAVGLSTTDLAFGYQQVNTASAPQAVTVTNTGTRSLGFGNAFVNTVRFFIFGDSCSTHALQPGESCSISVSFLPNYDGAISGVLVIPDNAVHGQQLVDLDGFGGEQPTLGTDATVNGMAGTDLAFQVTASGTPAPSVSIHAGALPPGLTLGSDNVISGVPTTAGTFQATLEASNSVGSPAYETLTFAIATRVQITVSSASVAEGNRGPTAMTFSYRLGRAVATPVTFHYATKDGTAVAGSDYVRTFGTVTVPAGTKVGAIAVNVRGDRTVEPDEQFALVLTKLVGLTTQTHSVVGTIVNDD